MLITQILFLVSQAFTYKEAEPNYGKSNQYKIKHFIHPLEWQERQESNPRLLIWKQTFYH